MDGRLPRLADLSADDSPSSHVCASTAICWAHFHFLLLPPRPQFLELQRVVVDLCARHQLLGEKCTYVLAAFEQERVEKEKRDGEIARLKAAARTADSDRRDLQLRYDAALVATASRDEKDELLRLRSAFRNLEERAQRLEAANRQLERLAQDNDIAVPDSVEMFRPLVSEWATRAAKAGRRPGAGREARQRQWQLTLPITSFRFLL